MNRCLSLLLGLLLLTIGNSQGFAQAKPGKHLAPEEQKPHFVLPKDFAIELVAAEPLVINPITMTMDEKGRLYVSESHTYRYGPRGSPVKPYSNPIVRLDPLPGGKGQQRVVVADGFEEPVMGLAVRAGKLWCTANNLLFLFDLAEDGTATNRRTILVDKNKAWNPFGMFVLEWGPDGLLYLSVGNHAIDIHGTNNRVSGRGSSGIVLRMKPDGSDMERLVHGLRVPYSFEYDPFGQLWLLSNGEGNPNRFVRVIDGVDYHCYSRPAVDSDWLSGKHPLAPPCFSLPSGACTQLVRYYGAAFPESYQGSLLLDNWGAHGFNGGNRAIFRYVPDDRGTITSRETFLSCADPHFRPSHVVLDPDGNLLVADWYGRDDESDLTGRIWRVKYTGPDRPTVQHRLDGDGWNDDRYAVAALGSPHHLIRDKAIQELIAHGPRVIDRLADHAASAREPLGAANALWVLLRIGTPQAQAAIASGARHADWRVRRLAVNILRRYRLDSAAAVARQLGSDDHPAVRLEAALAHSQPEAIRASLLAALKHGADRDEHLRYEAAWHLAKHADSRTFAPLLSSLEETIRLTGLIAIDIACFEGFASKPLALKALAHALEDPERKTDHELLLTLAQLNGDPSIGAALEKLLARTDLPPRLIARALLVLRSKTFSPHQSLSAAATRRFLDELEKGSIKLKLSDAAERTLFFELLEAAGPTEFTLKQLGLQLTAASPVRSAALGLARKFGSKASGLAEPLWPRALDPRGNPLDRLEMVATLACIEASPTKANWERLLADDNALVRFEAVREWRHFKDKPELVEALVRRVPDLLKHDRAGKDDLAVVLRQLAVPAAVLDKLGLPEPDTDKDQLATRLLAAAAKVPLAERQQKVLLGRRVFERTGCVKCHTTVTDNTLLAPSLKGIATAQKVDYLVESVLHPSKIIKTGYESEQVLTVQGKVLSGLIKEDGAFLRILTAEGETRLAKKDVAERAVQKVSIMPEGQEKLISFPEFLDLLIYLLSFK